MNAPEAFSDMSIYWFLPPLALAISLVYSGTRFESPRYILIYGARWAIYILTFLVATWIFIALLGTANYIYLPIALGGLALFLFGGGKKKAPPPKSAQEASPAS